MDQEIYGKDGLCLRCKGTNVCHSCNGRGRITSGGKEITCPTCFGGGDCKFCHGKKKEKLFIHQKRKAVL